MADQIIAITSVAGMAEAEILRGMLEARGIPVWLSHESAGTAIGLAVGRLGRVDVFVLERDQAKATGLLQAYLADKPEQDPDSPD